MADEKPEVGGAEALATAEAFAAASGDWPAALADARSSDAWLEIHASANKLLTPLRSVWIQPLEALAMARSGDVASAEKLAEAVRQAPSLPFAFSEWGEMQLAKGGPRGRDSRTPHFADVLLARISFTTPKVRPKGALPIPNDAYCQGKWLTGTYRAGLGRHQLVGRQRAGRAGRRWN
jgi:hypothetical protein